MRSDEKARRMALRRDAGNRLPPVPKPVRGTPRSYFIAHVCFACRKSFKIAPRPNFEAACPNCGGAVHEMGRSFKAPPSRNLGQWAKVQALYGAGFRFFSYRTFNCPPLPDRLSQVEAFIRDNPDHPLRVAGPGSSLAPIPPRGSAKFGR
jgi:ribosomal protein S27E